MTDSIFDRIKNEVGIADVVTHFGVKLDRNDKARCPFHEEKTGSFSIKRDDNIFYCFGCGEKGDAVHFVSKLKNMEPLDAAKLIAEIFRIEGGEAPRAAAPKSTKPAAKPKTDIKKYITACIRDAGQTEYFARRGLTEETVARFSLGYDAEKQAVVIPYNKKLNYYQTRSVVDKQFRKPKTEDAGEEPLFNEDAIKEPGRKPVFVVESPICAISIAQCGGSAVSICGATGGAKLINALPKKTDKVFILCLDNDEPGQKASKEIAAQLLERNIKYHVTNIADEYKDPNELLIAAPQKLAANIQKARQQAKAKFMTSQYFSATDIQDKELAPLRWIVKDIIPQGLNMIAAPSKAGKSWMMLQLCIAVASGGKFLDEQAMQAEVLYMALEDNERRLQSRMNKQLGGKKVPRGIGFVLKAKQLDTGLFEEIEELLEERNNKISLVIIDTFQVVRSDSKKGENQYQYDYRELRPIKEFADKHNIAILLVHHLRKMKDDDIYNQISGSTGLMAVCDGIFAIGRKKRNEGTAEFFITGRDVDARDLTINFDKAKCMWELIGTAEENEIKKADREYEENPIVKTIKALVEKNPYGGWKGNASELLMASYDVLGYSIAESPGSIGKVINNFKYRLHCDGIEHDMKQRSRTHRFYKKNSGFFAYMQKENDDE